MNFFLLVELGLLLLFLNLKLRNYAQLSNQDKAILIDRWSFNFTFELLNRALLFMVGFVWVVELTHPGVSVLHFVFYILSLDFLFYWRHRFYHRYLWGIHLTHHSDPGFDFSLSSRVHPIETAIQLILFLFVSEVHKVSQGQMLLAIHIFTIQALLSHLDYEIPKSQSIRLLRFVFVFPDEHRFHHDPKNPMTHFGFLFSFWDRIFKTHKRTI